MTSENTISRRGLFMKLGILFNGLVATALTVPIVRFLLSSVTRGRASAYLSWVPLGRVNEFPEGETRLATFTNPYVTPTDGKTVDTACWVRRVEGGQFQVFAIDCGNQRTWAAPCAGFRNPACSCAPATAERTIATVRALRARRNAGCSSIRTRCRTVWLRFKLANCRLRDPQPPLFSGTRRRAVHGTSWFPSRASCPPPAKRMLCSERQRHGRDRTNRPMV